MNAPITPDLVTSWAATVERVGLPLFLAFLFGVVIVILYRRAEKEREGWRAEQVKSNAECSASMRANAEASAKLAITVDSLRDTMVEVRDEVAGMRREIAEQRGQLASNHVAAGRR